MSTQIPEFLLEMSKQMHEQDNRITAEPIFQVRYKKYLVTAEGYNESHYEIVDCDGSTVYHSAKDNWAELEEYLLEHHEEWCIDWAENNLDCDDEADLKEHFKDNFPYGPHEEYPDMAVVFLQETEEVVKSCLTEADAKWFIQRKQHDYPPLYIYVESMVFCPQMIQLRNWIMGLTETGEVAA